MNPRPLTARAKRTRLTKRGEPVQGTTIEVATNDTESGEDFWAPAKVVGKGWSTDNRLVMIVVEWDDGYREWVDRFPDLIWRSIP